MATAFETVAADFQKLQKDYSKTLSNREQLESQFRENELVLKELKLLKDDSKVFKLIGPALVAQEKVEALTNVEKRIDFIKTEIKRVEVLIKESEEKQEKKRDELIKMQQEMQKAQKK